MSGGPLFPKKSETTDDVPTTGSQVEIERSNDPNFKNTSSSQRNLPTMSGKQIGCGSSVFVLMLVVALLVVGQAIL